MNNLDNILNSVQAEEQKKQDELDIMLKTKWEINLNNYEKSTNKKFIISTFWLTKNEDGDEYIYFLV